ncbi:MAG: methyltransferase domain-containing protein [Candidatus Melainabacteria bacterium]|nr:methyltransferase domain-containing protein [Candidatus Melainabacteria bacterium]
MGKSTPDGEKPPYIQTQRQYFDERVDFFRAPVPAAIQARTRRIVESAGLREKSRVLDVGTGVGVLVAHFLEFGVSQENIVGLDLSQEMLRGAKSRFPDVFFCQSDIADVGLPLPKEFPANIECFDVVFFNACFGNMWNQQEAVMAAVRLLDAEGLIVISHPLGARFVDSLRRNEPHIVPHQLPEREKLEALCSESNLAVVSADIQDDFYLVILRKKAEWLETANGTAHNE